MPFRCRFARLLWRCMPTYTYRCQKCGEEFERFQSMSDEPVKRCPTCKGKVQRVFHPVGIVLKGSGFHKTDYRSKKSSAERAAGEGKPDSSSSETKGSETKSSDSKGSDGKGSETTGSGSKSAEKKSSGAKSKDD